MKIRNDIKSRIFIFENSTVIHEFRNGEFSMMAKLDKLLIEYNDFIRWPNTFFSKLNESVFQHCRHNFPISSYYTYVPVEYIIKDYFDGKPINNFSITMCSYRNDLTSAFIYIFRHYLLLSVALAHNKCASSSKYLKKALGNNHDTFKL